MFQETTAFGKTTELCLPFYSICLIPIPETALKTKQPTHKPQNTRFLHSNPLRGEWGGEEVKGGKTAQQLLEQFSNPQREGTPLFPGCCLLLFRMQGSQQCQCRSPLAVAWGTTPSA